MVESNVGKGRVVKVIGEERDANSPVSGTKGFEEWNHLNGK